MKGISLWEPWASAIAHGFKQIETRAHRTNHRGPLAICAARTKLHAGFIHEPAVCGFFQQVGIVIPDHLAFGCIVAVANVVDCRRTEDLRSDLSRHEIHFGNYAAGRWGWILADVRRLKKPIPFRGNQALFNVPDELLQEVA